MSFSCSIIVVYDVPGTTKVLRGVSLLTGALGMTKAPSPTHFSPARLPASPRGVSAGEPDFGGDEKDEGKGLGALDEGVGRPTPKTTFAKCVGTPMAGGLPIIL